MPDDVVGVAEPAHVAQLMRLDHPHDQALCGPKGAGDRRSPT
jgi:hypothetical protein